VAEAKVGELGAEGGEVSRGGGAEAIPKGKRQLPSAERARHGHCRVDAVGEEGRKHRGEGAGSAPAVKPERGSLPTPTLTMVRRWNMDQEAIGTTRRPVAYLYRTPSAHGLRCPATSLSTVSRKRHMF
jgi:hypothetical protein